MIEHITITENLKKILNYYVMIDRISKQRDSNIEKGFTISDKYQAAVETLDEIDIGITNIIKLVKENVKKIMISK